MTIEVVEQDDLGPVHLRPMDAIAELKNLLDKIAFAVRPRHRVVLLELKAFAESRSPHDGTRLSIALRHIAGLPGLADQLDLIITADRQECRHAAQ